MMPLFKIRINDGIIPRLKEVFASGYIGEGLKVKELENKLSNLLNGYVVLVNSGTSALHLAYQITGISGWEVISTPMTCLATNTPILHNGGKIVWADVEPDTGNIDIYSVARKITTKTKAVVCVHYGGNICNQELVNLCYKYGLTLIEDCAHLASFGLGGLQCYSFQAIKFLTTVDGGALVTSDKDIYERSKLLRWYGIDRESGGTMRCMNPVFEAGHKFHMNDVAASVGLANIEDLSFTVSKAQVHAQKYNREFAGLNGIKTVPVATRNDYWMYILLVDDRDGFMAYMKENGIETSLVHARNDIQPIFNDARCNLPGLEEFWAKQVCIPVGWWLSDDDVDYIIDKVKQYEKACVS